MASLRRAVGLASAFRARPLLALPQPVVTIASPAQVRFLGGHVRPEHQGPTKRRGGNRRRQSMGKTLAIFLGTGAVAYATTSYFSEDASAKDKRKRTKDFPEGVPDEVSYYIPKAKVEFEPAVEVLQPDGDIRDALSPQHRQMKHSVEHPGVYAWGSNAGRVVAPDSADAMIREPRRISFFDGQVLRDLLLNEELGVAVTEAGDVVQWGAAFWGRDAVPAAPAWAKAAKGSKGSKAAKTAQTAAPTVPLAPATTLQGKNIVKVAVSNDRVLALAANGTVYSLPQSMQALGMSAVAADDVLAWSAPPTDLARANIRTAMTPTGLGWGERVVDVRAGQEHAVLLTNKGRVFAAVASFSSFPARGQLGVPGLTWQTRPTDRPLDAAVEVPGLVGKTVAQIAAGDYHTVVLARHHAGGGADSTAVFAFGDNSTGQLGVAASPTAQFVAAPVEVPLQKLYEPRSDGTPLGNNYAAMQRQDVPVVRATAVAAGGATTFFSVDAASRASPGHVTADVWSSGSGIYGTLGTGKWVHISTTGPGKVRALSGLAEYSEAARATVPIRARRIEVGATHAMAVLENATNVASKKETNWGADTLWWGGNEYYQLGTGKRSNQAEPVHIAPLDAVTVVGPARKDKLVLEPLEQKTLPQAGATTNLDLARERLALTPRTSVRLRDGHKVSMEQRAVCGRYVSGVYSGV